MATIFEHKEQAVTETPLLLFDCQWADGQVERWSTHGVTVSGEAYLARVVGHNLFEIQTASEQGVDAIPRVSITLANADSRFSEIERTRGFKGARLTARFLFYNLKDAAEATESTVVFQGIANPPEEIRQATLRITAINRMSMQRVQLPDVRVQRRCPWEFPATAEQREEAVTGGERAQYSRLFRCGYSPGVAGGAGSLSGTEPYTSCGRTRADCEARGMFREDAGGQVTRRFGGVEFLPPSVLVRSFGEKGQHAAAVTSNEARYNDFVPLVYGTAWHTPPVVFARNDGNLTHMEVLLGMGEIESVLKVLVNDIEIPPGQTGENMGGTGWYNLPGTGNRTGNFNLDFTGAGGEPAGDPYGSMAYISLVVPNRVSDGRTLPAVKVLMQGLRLPRFQEDGAFVDLAFTSNPAWVLLDLLRRSGWGLGEIDLGSFAAAAAYCDEAIAAQDLYGNPVSVPRFQCNLVVKARKSAADLIRGVRGAARMYLTYGTGGGLLRLRVENTLALESPVKPAWSNAAEPLDGGWPSYEFGDGAPGTTGIVRLESGEPSMRLRSRGSADSPNRFTVEFQDSFNEYQQDSFSLVDAEDASRTGQEVTAPLAALGLPSYEQAARILKYNLDRSVRGNVYAEFESSVRVVGLSPGDLIAITYLKEGFIRQPFRVLRIAPGMNYRTSRITAQIHDDAWYADSNGQTEGSASGRQPGLGLGAPHPLVGNTVDSGGANQYEIVESANEGTDGSQNVEASVGFLVPDTGTLSGVGIPLINLAAAVDPAGGTLAGAERLYYCVSAVDSGGRESGLSFRVPAAIPPGTNTNAVTLSGLGFSAGTAGFHVYRGPSPVQLFRIASNQAPAAQFTDTGLAGQLQVAPDRNFDHANFYWRLELEPELAATIHSAATVGNGTLEMVPNGHRGDRVRITRGRGAGQERSVFSNTETELTLQPAWDIAPDSTSRFTVTEGSWRFGATGKTSPVHFEIPNRAGATIHVLGLAANAAGVESPAELATVTRWFIGGAEIPGSDADASPQPVFGVGLAATGGGVIEVSGVAFPTFVNTRTITAATLTVHYWNELSGAPALELGAAATEADTALTLASAAAAAAGSYLQIEGEVLKVESVTNGGLGLAVTRAAHGSTAAPHAALTPVYLLSRRVAIAPFPRDFFGSPSSGGWSFPVALPDVRIASAELFVTNQRGNSPVASIALTGSADYGLRTLSSGQYSIQVEGFLAIENGVAPDLVVEASHAVRDVFAVVTEAPLGGPLEMQLRQDGAPYCSLTIPDGAHISSAADGLALGPLLSGSKVSLDITAVGPDTPGSELTVTIRL